MNEKLNIFEQSKINPKTIKDFKKYVPDITNEEHKELAIKIFEEHSKNKDINVSNAAKEVLSYFREETLKKLDNLNDRNFVSGEIIQAANDPYYKREYRSVA